MIPYRFHPKALAEYEAAAAWYGDRASDAARRFVTHVEDAIAVIRELPRAWPLWPGYDDVRARVLRRLPYTIVYLVTVGEIVVMAVAHQRRRPGYWVDRLER